MVDPSREQPSNNGLNLMALRVTAGVDQNKVFPLVEGFIGRQASCDIALTDPSLSAMHARITLRRDSWFITDLTSAPDIRVNNTVVKSRKIQYGDTIVIGKTTLQVVDAPAGLETPRKIETKRMPAVTKDAPSSQTMAISLDGKVEGWTPGKPDPEKRAEAREKKKAAAKPNPRDNAEAPVEADSLSKYRTKAYQKDEESEKSGSRLLVYTLILIAVATPIFLGSLYLLSRKYKKQELSQSYAAAQAFELNNPGKYEEAIAEYRKLQMQATGAAENLATIAGENISRLEAEALQHAADLNKVLATLDGRADALEDEGDFAGAAGVYDEYSGKLKAEVAAARKTKASTFRELAKKQTVVTTRPPVAAPQPTTTAADADTASVKRSNAKLKTIVASAVDLAIKGDTGEAIKELEKISQDPALKASHALSEEAIISMKLLETVDKTVKASTINGAAPIDPAENKDQPVIIRLVYSLRKGDLLAAQFLAKTMDHTLLFDELSARSRMSRDDLLREQAVMQEFANTWSGFTKATTTTIPRPDECADMLETMKASQLPKQVSDFCLSMTRLQGKNSESLFITRYSPFFDACLDTYNALNSQGSQTAGCGNAKIIDADGNSFFFESVTALPDPAQGQVGLFTERDVFFDPAANTPVAAKIEVLAILKYRKISDKQGAFDLPADFKLSKPLKGDRVFVGKEVALGTQLASLKTQQPAETIYSAIFEGRKPPDRWNSQGATLQNTAQGHLQINAPGAEANPPAGTPTAWFDAKLDNRPVDISMTLVQDTNSEFVITLDKMQFVLSGSKERLAGTWFDGHMVKAQTLPALPIKTPIPLSISWTPVSASISVGGNTMTSSADAVRPSQGLSRIGFITAGKSTLSNFTITRPHKLEEAKVIGINKTSTSVIVTRGSSVSWDNLQPGHSLFLLNNIPATKKGVSSPGWDSIQATVSEISGDFIVCAIGSNNKFVTASTKASLTKNMRNEPGPVRDPAHYLSASGWHPEVVYAELDSNAKGEPVLTPDLPCSYAPRGFVSRISDSIVHPFSHEPFAVYPAAPQPTELSENAGQLQFPAITSLVSTGKESVAVLLTGLSPAVGALVALSPPSFPIMPLSATRSPQGWKMTNEEWTHKFGRLVSPLNPARLPVVASPSVLWENGQYSLDLKIDAASTNNDMNEIIVEAYSPFWNRSISLSTGTRGTSIDFDKVQGSPGSYKVGGSYFASSADVTTTWDSAFKKSRPQLKPGTVYNLKVRRAKGDVAFYINGKRLAVVSYPGLSGDLVLRVACPQGQISLGQSQGTMLSRSTRIPATEPDLGDFGYVLAVEGANIFVDADTTGLVRGGQISLMKVEKVIAGDLSKTILLRRVAMGTVTDMTTRIAKAITSAPSEPITAGMKVMIGRAPDTLTITSDRLASVNEGL